MHYNLRQTTHEQDTQTLFCSRDPDFDSIALIYELDWKILKMYLHAKNELSRARLSKVRALQTNGHRWIQLKTLPCHMHGH